MKRSSDTKTKYIVGREFVKISESFLMNCSSVSFYTGELYCNRYNDSEILLDAVGANSQGNIVSMSITFDTYEDVIYKTKNIVFDGDTNEERNKSEQNIKDTIRQALEAMGENDILVERIKFDFRYKNNYSECYEYHYTNDCGIREKELYLKSDYAETIRND